MSACREKWFVPTTLQASPSAPKRSAHNNTRSLDVTTQVVDNEMAARTEELVVDVDVKSGDVVVHVLRSSDSILSKPTWETLQVGKNEHARFGFKALKMNHSSTPNLKVEISENAVALIARANIAAGTPLTFDYRTTEWSMDAPFVDWTSGETIAGFAHATAADQKALLPHAAPHIRALFEEMAVQFDKS